MNLKMSSSIIKAVTSMENEKIIGEYQVIKFNKTGKKQKRNLILTNKFLYNVRSNNLITSTFSFLSNRALIKRKLDLREIDSIVYSIRSQEFLINIPSKFDYRIKFEERDSFIINIFTALESLKIFKLKFIITKYVQLEEFTNHKSLIKKGVIKNLPSNYVEMTKESFIDFANDHYNKRQELEYQKENIINSENLKLLDFDFLNLIDEGGFGRVYLAENNNKLYAIKTIKKKFIIEKRYLDQIKSECRILNLNNNPFLINLLCSFQTNSKIYLVMPFIPGGTLGDLLIKETYIPEDSTLFYISQILKGLECLHNNNIIYQDLKPDNVLIEKNGYLKLCDFGACKFVDQVEQDYSSFIGTREYMAPEILKKIKYSKQVDIYALGILTYELLFGETPFSDIDNYKLYKNILNKKLIFPDKIYISKDCKDFILNCLQKNPNERFNGKGVEGALNHPWIKKTNMTNLLNQRIKAPFIPKKIDKKEIENKSNEYLVLKDEIIGKKTKELLKYHEKDFEILNN